MDNWSDWEMQWQFWQAIISCIWGFPNRVYFFGWQCPIADGGIVVVKPRRRTAELLQIVPIYCPSGALIEPLVLTILSTFGPPVLLQVLSLVKLDAVDNEGLNLWHNCQIYNFEAQRKKIICRAYAPEALGPKYYMLVYFIMICYTKICRPRHSFLDTRTQQFCQYLMNLWKVKNWKEILRKFFVVAHFEINLARWIIDLIQQTQQIE